MRRLGVRRLGLLWVLLLVASGATGLALGVNYRTQLRHTQRRLMTTADTWARFIQGFAALNAASSVADSVTGVQLRRAFSAMGSFGATGDILVAERRGGFIDFIARADSTRRPRVPFDDTTLAVPMRRALLGSSGTVVARDYRGVRVLAAYEPVGVFGWGVVAKMDLTEVRAPFWTAALMAVLGSVLLMTGSILGVRRLRLTAVRRAQKIERRYRTILDQVPAGVLVGEAAITYANQAALRMLQTTLQQILGKRPWEIAPDVQRDGRPSREVARDVVAAARRGDRPRLTFTLRRDDGSTFTASADVARIEVDGETDLVASFQDVTDREAAEKDLRLLEQALNQAGEAVIITDAAARIEYVNPAFEKITGYTLAEALGKNPSILKSGQQDQAFYQKMWNELGRGGPVQRRFVNRRKDGSIYLQDSIIAPLLDRNGTAVNYVAVARDVTQLVGLEEERRQGQKLESIGQLTTGIAHDFNNLLTVMLANSELAVAAAAAGVPFPEDYANELKAAAQRARDLVRSLLGFARHSAITRSTLDARDCVRETHKMLSRTIREDVRIDLDIPDESCPILADPSAIHQILLNLATNARDAMPAGGRLHIRLARHTVDEAEAARHRGLKPGAYVRMQVEDTGAGIAPEHLPRLFEPFFTTKPVGQGTGLGLAMVYGLVKQHDGYVYATSELGKGTAFAILLPLVHAAREVAPRTLRRVTPPSVRPPAPTTLTRTVLLVDDDPTLRRVGKRVLEQAGYAVLLAENGTDALALMRAHRDRVDLILSDQIMPGMGGVELFSALRADGYVVPFVLASGHSSGEEPLEAGITEFLRKPWTIEEMLSVVRSALETGRAA